MGLSCNFSDDGDCAWYFTPPNDISILASNKRKRCTSCKELISIGDASYKFERFRYAQNEIEDRIYGDGTEIPLASWYMCEKCGDQYMNLEALGFCVDITENMFKLLEEYVEEYGTRKTAA